MASDKRARFVEEYIIDLNATQAAIRAGYSPKTANEQGARLLAIASVQESIQAALSARSKRTQVTQDMVVNELRRIAFLDPRKVMTWDDDKVKLVASDQLSDDEAMCVVEVSETITKDGGTRKIKFADKLAALGHLGKHLGMFVDRVQITGKDDGPVQVSEVVVSTRAQAEAVLKEIEKRQSADGRK